MTLRCYTVLPGVHPSEMPIVFEGERTVLYVPDSPYFVVDGVAEAQELPLPPEYISE